MESPSLCQVCRNCLINQVGMQEATPDTLNDLPGTRCYLAHKTAGGLVRSSEGGCTICSILWNELSDAQQKAVLAFSVQNSLTFLMLQPSSLIRTEGGWLLTAWIEDKAKAVEGEPDHEILVFFLQPKEEAECFYSSRPLSASTESQESWELALTWLERCCNTHSECKSAAQSSWYPTRLLDVGTRPTDSVRLVITEDRQLTDNYVTLSHCWGKPSPLKLTRQSQKRLVDGVNVSELPLTFQHAIVVAKRLSTKFIWIDSLCIFQDDDDKSDWLREAQLMDKVYTHACLNISATASTDGSQGLFRSRDPAVVLKPTIVSWCPPTNGTQDPREKAEWVLTELFFLNRQLMHEPLHHRAWVLQERLLANRVLHFGASQLFWECKHGVLCERFPDHLPSFMHNFGPATFKSFTGAYGQVFAPTTTATPPDSAMYKLLNKVVDAYSQSLLTYHSDKLIALSGIAKLMQGMFQDEYIVGMWRSCLASQLPWSVQEAMKVNGEPSTRNFAYRAPTWTWMSVEGIINFPFDATCNNLWIEVLDVKLRHATADTTGLALDGHLMLKGRLRPLCLRRLTATLNDQDPELAQRVEEKGISSSAFDRPIPRQWIMTVNGKDLQLPHGKLWERGGPLVHLDVDQPNFDDSNQKGELYMVSAHGPGYDKNDPYASPKEPSTFHKILLLRCVEAKRGVFHRFGVATLDTNKTEIFDFVKEHDVNEADMPCVEYDAKQHLHTIVVK